MNSTELKQVADHLRMTAVDMVYKGKDGHPGPALSIADIMAVLFFDEMRIDPANPEWEDRDRFILKAMHVRFTMRHCLRKDISEKKLRTSS